MRVPNCTVQQWCGLVDGPEVTKAKQSKARGGGGGDGDDLLTATWAVCVRGGMVDGGFCILYGEKESSLFTVL